MDRKFKDKILICIDCREEFVFTVSAQQYFAERGYSEDPKRCKSCYMTIKRNRKPAEVGAGLTETEAELEQEPLGLGHDDFAEGESGNLSDHV